MKPKLGMKSNQNLFFFEFFELTKFFLFKYTFLRWTLNENYIRSFLFKILQIFSFFKFFNFIKNSFNFIEKWKNLKRIHSKMKELKKNSFKIEKFVENSFNFNQKWTNTVFIKSSFQNSTGKPRIWWRLKNLEQKKSFRVW